MKSKAWQALSLRRRLIAAGTAGLMIALPTAAQAQDAAGKASFARCSICHSINGSGGKLGPDLTGVVGRKAGSVPGYAYSTAMKGSNIVWTSKELGQFLEGPQKMVPGTRMSYPGVANPADRDKIIAYLRSSAAK